MCEYYYKNLYYLILMYITLRQNGKEQFPWNRLLQGSPRGLLCVVVRKSNNHTFRVSPLDAVQDIVW